jgi:hypothetical protein
MVNPAKEEAAQVPIRPHSVKHRHQRRRDHAGAPQRGECGELLSLGGVEDRAAPHPRHRPQLRPHVSQRASQAPRRAGGKIVVAVGDVDDVEGRPEVGGAEQVVRRICPMAPTGAGEAHVVVVREQQADHELPARDEKPASRIFRG